MHKNIHPNCNITHANSLKRFFDSEKESVGVHRAESSFLTNSSVPQTVLVIFLCLVEMRLPVFSEIDSTAVCAVLRISDVISSHGFTEAEKINSHVSFIHPVSLPA